MSFQGQNSGSSTNTGQSKKDRRKRGKQRRKLNYQAICESDVTSTSFASLLVVFSPFSLSRSPLRSALRAYAFTQVCGVCLPRAVCIKNALSSLFALLSPSHKHQESLKDRNIYVVIHGFGCWREREGETLLSERGENKYGLTSIREPAY